MNRTADGREKVEAFWVISPGRGEIREVEVASPALPGGGRDEDLPVLVRARFSGISRGTETLIFRGEVPPSEHQRMRCPFQEGDFPAPVKYGYSSVGEVVAGPSALLGRRIFCLYPHQTLYEVPASAVHPLPEDLPSTRAVLAANMETAINAVWDAAPRAGDRVVVIGAGVVGSFLASLAGQVPGVSVQLVDVAPKRARIAEQLGVAFAEPEEVCGEADLVYHTSGNPEGLRTALRAAGFEATVVEVSWYGAREVSLPLGEDFHAKRLKLISSQVGTLAPARRIRRNHRDRLALALKLLCDPRYDILIDGEHPFAELPEVMRRLSDPAEASLCHRIIYPS